MESKKGVPMGEHAAQATAECKPYIAAVMRAVDNLFRTGDHDRRRQSVMEVVAVAMVALKMESELARKKDILTLLEQLQAIVREAKAKSTQQNDTQSNPN